MALIWLAYVAGVNGYMLPWDRLAQFVTQASFEWLDWLPGFGGTLIRNFIQPEHVSNRLFSLLVFIHIGVPLVMLLVMWIHVQRVPKAATQPPRPIALALLVMLVVLALAAPVASQGPADLRTAPAVLALDWFLLALFPLLYAWPLGAVWGLVGGATLLLLAMPWLPPRRGAAQPRQLTLHPGPVRVDGASGETLLEAGLRAGLALPYDCRAGGCGLCACTVLDGRVDLGAYPAGCADRRDAARGQALMCCAVALEDVELEVEGVSTLAAVAGSVAGGPRRWQAKVVRMERLAPDLMRLSLQLPDGQRLSFAAGQYINIVLDDGARRAFSFANAPPARDALIELHVRRIPGGRFTTPGLRAHAVGDTIDFEGPLGRFTLHESERPILFVAGATGFAPIKSIIEDAFHRGIRRPMQLYWGVRRPGPVPARAGRRLAARPSQLRLRAGAVERGPRRPLAGRRGWVHEALLADHPDLTGYEVYACGSVQMVEAAVPAFIAQGLAEQFCFSDAFLPAPPAPPVAPATAA